MATTPRVNYSGYNEDETYCSRGICPHPSCWESHVRAAKGFKKYTTESPRHPQQLSSSTSDDELPKYNMYNMLDDYGPSSQDIFPSRQINIGNNFTSGRRMTIPSAPLPSPMKERSVTEMSLKELIEPEISSIHMKSVEVQEVFDLEELNQSWDNTFIAKPVYVWVPNMKKRTRRKRSSARHCGSERLNQSTDLVNVKNVTDELMKKGRDLTESSIKPISRPAVNIPTGGQPYKNVGQTPKDRMRYRQIMEDLKDLPRPFILEVLEKTKGMKNKEEILLIMEKYLKLMPKTDYEMSMVTGQVLQQRPLHSSLINEHDKILRHEPRDIRYKLDKSPARELITGGETNKYKPLPDITTGESNSRKSKRRSVRVQLTGSSDGLKPFHYAKVSDFHVNLEPEERSRTISRLSTVTQTRDDADSPTEVKADLSVLYDAESVMKNNENTTNNNNNNLGVVPPTADNLMDETPRIDRPVEILESVDETGDKLTRELRVATAPLEIVSHSVEGRVKSAQIITEHNIGRLKRTRSLDLSAVPIYSQSRAEQLVELERTGGVPLSQNPSRLDAQSTTSNWPNVDEEEILKAQTIAEQRPVSEAKLPTQPSTASETRSISRRKIVVELQIKTGNDEPPPPPPSPEPANKKNSRDCGEDGSNNISQTSEPSTERSHADTNRRVVDTYSQVIESERQVQVVETGGLAIKEETEEKSAGESLIAEFKADFDMTVQRSEDPFSTVTDYHDIDNDRELTLSVLPPSNLDSSTPHHTPARITTVGVASESITEPQSAVIGTATSHQKTNIKVPNTDSTRPISRELPAIIHAMNSEDQGGFAGQ